MRGYYLEDPILRDALDKIDDKLVVEWRYFVVDVSLTFYGTFQFNGQKPCIRTLAVVSNHLQKSLVALSDILATWTSLLSFVFSKFEIEIKWVQTKSFCNLFITIWGGLMLVLVKKKSVSNFLV